MPYFRIARHLLLLAWLAATIVATMGCRRDVAELPAATPVVASVTPTPKQPAEDQGPLAITWEQLELPIPPDAEYQSWMMTTRVEALEGRQVQIQGYMFGGLLQTSGIRSFPLVKDKECAFGEGCQPHHAINVELAGKLRAAYTAQPVTVTGRFHIRPWTGPNGKTWSLYHLEVTKME